MTRYPVTEYQNSRKLKKCFTNFSGNAEYDPDYKDSKSGSSNRTQNKGEDEVLTGMINYKGSVLDIESLLDRLEKSEKTRLDMEKEMQKLSKDRGKVPLYYKK